MWDYLETSMFILQYGFFSFIWIICTGYAAKPLSYAAQRIVSILPQRYRTSLAKTGENLELLYFLTVCAAPFWIIVYYAFTSGSGEEYNFGVPYMFQ